MSFKKGDIARFYMDANRMIGDYFLILEKPVTSGTFCSYCKKQEVEAYCMFLDDNSILKETDLCDCFVLLGENK